MAPPASNSLEAFSVDESATRPLGVAMLDLAREAVARVRAHAVSLKEGWFDPELGMLGCTVSMTSVIAWTVSAPSYPELKGPACLRHQSGRGLGCSARVVG
jgi:hypothetical protein